MFGSGQGSCGQFGIVQKFMRPESNKWEVGRQFFKGCQDANVPKWARGTQMGRASGLGDYDAPTVWYSGDQTFRFHDKDGVKQQNWVMFYGVFIATPDGLFV